jgi:hypothetical protein
LISPLICVSTFLSASDVSTLFVENVYPLYDRQIPLQGLSLEFDSHNNPYIKVPSITYFQDLPEPDSINKLYNLTERVIDISGNILIVDSDYEKFYDNDDIQIVKFDKGKYSIIEEVSSHVITASGTTNSRYLNLDKLPETITSNSNYEYYVLNNTYRTVSSIENVLDTYALIDVSGYAFEPTQMVSLIVTDLNTNYSWGGTYKVNQVSGSSHYLDNTVPLMFVDNPGKYSIQIKHAFSTYVNYTIDTSQAFETGQYFYVYLKNDYKQQYYIDNTFVLTNLLFDHEEVNDQWYDPSDNFEAVPYYYYSRPVQIDVSTLMILKSEYDSSSYLLGQKNIWTVKRSLDKTVLFKVYNESVPYIFDVSGYYDIELESYDRYGNLSTKTYEGLLNVTKLS